MGLSNWKKQTAWLLRYIGKNMPVAQIIVTFMQFVKDAKERGNSGKDGPAFNEINYA